MHRHPGEYLFSLVYYKAYIRLDIGYFQSRKNQRIRRLTMVSNNNQNSGGTTAEKADHQTRIFGINIQTVIPFISYRWFTLFGISAVVIISGFTMYFIKGGFPLGIDFKGGIKVDVQVNNPDVDIKKVRQIFIDSKTEADINTVGNPSDRQFMITLPIVSSENSSDEVRMILGKKFGDSN